MEGKNRDNYKIPWPEENFSSCWGVSRGRVCKLKEKIRDSYKIPWQKENLGGCQSVAGGQSLYVVNISHIVDDLRQSIPNLCDIMTKIIVK